MTPINRETEALLNAEAARINSRAFIADDPVQFPRRFSDPRDIEIAALLLSLIHISAIPSPRIMRCFIAMFQSLFSCWPWT